MLTAEAAHTETLPMQRQPLEGLALLEMVARLVLKGADARTIARKCHLSAGDAQRLHAEVFRQVYQSIEDDYGPDRLKAEKFSLKQKLKREIENCERAVERSFRDNKPNTRPYTHMNTAVKLLAAMDGHNAPVQTVNTDIRVYAAVQPKDMDRVLRDPRARRAMIEFEEIVSQLNESDPADDIVLPDVPAVPGAGGDDE